MEEGDLVKSSLLGEEKLNHSHSITSVLVLSSLTVLWSSFALGSALGYPSPTEFEITDDLGISLAEYSIFISISSVGTLIGSAWSGKLADVIGRRGAIGFPGLLYVMGWLAIAFAKDALWLYIGRFLIGCGGGLSVYGVFVYISEITPKNVRGAVMSMTAVLMSCGCALFFVIGPFVHWRTLAMIGIVPFIFQLPALLLCPESPRWLMKIGEAHESENALRRLRGAKTDISQEIVEVKEFTEYCERISEYGILTLFQRKYARCLFIGIGALALSQLGGLGGISYNTSSIFQSTGFSTTIGSISVGIIQILSAIVALSLIDKFGRRPLLLISAAGCCLGCGLIAMSFLLQDLGLGDKITPFLALAGILVFFSFYSLGMGSIPWILVSEILPINVKGVGGSIASVVSMICGCIVSYSYNFMFEWSSVGTFFIYMVVSGVGILFIWMMVPETKGQSLEEIQAKFTATDHE